jgi:hypothetical protein
MPGLRGDNAPHPRRTLARYRPFRTTTSLLSRAYDGTRRAFVAAHAAREAHVLRRPVMTLPRDVHPGQFYLVTRRCNEMGARRLTG